MPLTLAIPGENTDSLAKRWAEEVGRRIHPEEDNRLVLGLGSHDLDSGQTLARARLHLASAPARRPPQDPGGPDARLRRRVRTAGPALCGHLHAPGRPRTVEHGHVGFRRLRAATGRVRAHRLAGPAQRLERMAGRPTGRRVLTARTRGTPTAMQSNADRAKRSRAGRARQARTFRSGPAALRRWGACRGWRASQRESDACVHVGSWRFSFGCAHPRGHAEHRHGTSAGRARHAPGGRPSPLAARPACQSASRTGPMPVRCFMSW